MLRPMFPKEPGAGGVSTPDPSTKHPKEASWSLAAGLAAARHLEPSEVVAPETCPWESRVKTDGWTNGIPAVVALKSPEFPAKSQRSPPSPVRLLSVDATTFHGC